MLGTRIVFSNQVFAIFIRFFVEYSQESCSSRLFNSRIDKLRYLLASLMNLRDLSILVVGANSLIGQELMQLLPINRIKVVGTVRNLLKNDCANIIAYDLCNDCDKEIDLSQFDWCVLCAAQTSIKECEENPQKSLLVNVDRTIDLIGKCCKAGVKVFYFSSNAVFDGSKKFHSIHDSTNPITNYGYGKLMVENYINEYAKESCCILRLTKVICTRTPIIKIWKKQILQGCAITAFATNFYHQFT